jgi:hypothetical protein
MMSIITESNHIIHDLIQCRADDLSCQDRMEALEMP